MGPGYVGLYRITRQGTHVDRPARCRLAAAFAQIVVLADARLQPAFITALRHKDPLSNEYPATVTGLRYRTEPACLCQNYEASTEG